MATVKGGDKLAGALKSIADRLSKASSVEVGFMAGSTYPDGTSIPMVAAINEFGAPSRGQPPRPFFRNMIAEHSGEWPAALARVLKESDCDAEKALGSVGEAIADQLRDSITNFTSPPLAESTIKKKGFSTPLVDKGIMQNSIEVEVK